MLRNKNQNQIYGRVLEEQLFSPDLKIRNDQNSDFMSQNDKKQFKISEKYVNQKSQGFSDEKLPKLTRQVWSRLQEDLLITAHNEKGNRWAEISKIVGKTDNAVKNHYHSKLRKGLRRINTRANSFLKTDFRPFKNVIISRIVQTAEKLYEDSSDTDLSLSRTCFKLKNKIIEQSQEIYSLEAKEVKQLERLVTELNSFNQTYNKKVKKVEKPKVSHLPKDVPVQNNGISSMNFTAGAPNSQAEEEELIPNLSSKQRSRTMSNSTSKRQQLLKKQSSAQEATDSNIERKYTLRSQQNGEMPAFKMSSQLQDQPSSYFQSIKQRSNSDKQQVNSAVQKPPEPVIAQEFRPFSFFSPASPFMPCINYGFIQPQINLFNFYVSPAMGFEPPKFQQLKAATNNSNQRQDLQVKSSSCVSDCENKKNACRKPSDNIILQSSQSSFKKVKKEQET